jgi:hypothetical protein
MPPLIITFSDWNYQPILQNWLLHLSALHIHTARVYCLDDRTFDWCRENSVDAEILSWDGDFAHLWERRLWVFNQLLEQGTEFIHSDADAIWVKNPLLPTSTAVHPEDMVFSQGTVWPPDVSKDWGFVLCCGWFWIKPSVGSRAFFRALLSHVESTHDDQVSINRLLQARGTRWDNDGRSDYTFPYNRLTVHCWASPLRGRTADGALSVVMLPQHQYQRVPIASPEAVVKHYLSPKRCADKIAALREWGLWLIAPT